MQQLNLPYYRHKIQTNIDTNTMYIFDIIRKKHIILTPEEWVRQNFIHYLINEKKFSKNLISIESEFKINNCSKRADIIAYNTNGKPILIVECKAPEIKITQKTFDQIATYNLNFKVDFLIVTNGITHYSAIIDYKNECWYFLDKIPTYEELLSTQNTNI